jgi:hypothetical protein
VASTTTPVTQNFDYTIDGTTTNDSTTGTWYGINVPRSSPTKFAFRNNSITSINTQGYMLQAGDEVAGDTNNNLNGEVITGNKFNWNGTFGGENGAVTHGVFTGYNLNALIKYNYLNNVPSGIQMKSNGMTNTSGGVAYNIVNNIGLVAIPVKGMKNVNIFNNTFYSKQVPYQSATIGVWRGLIDIYANTDEGQDPNTSNSSGTNIKNNIFYTKNQIYNISVHDTQSLQGFQSDYNVFYCESGTPMFEYLGVGKTFAQWQALGYDTHSVVVNPNFMDFTNFVPSTPLNYGTNLGTSWQAGLSTSAAWNVGSAPSMSNQSGTSWQVGARVSGTVLGASTYNFTLTLKLGSTGNEVTELQKVLVKDGYLTATPDGTFGPVTEVAVKAFQKANGLTADGIVGSKTREILNK